MLYHQKAHIPSSTLSDILHQNYRRIESPIFIHLLLMHHLHKHWNQHTAAKGLNADTQFKIKKQTDMKLFN